MTSKVNTGFPPLDTQLAVPAAYFQISNSLSGKINKQTKNNNKTPHISGVKGRSLRFSIWGHLKVSVGRVICVSRGTHYIKTIQATELLFIRIEI